jgi:CRISPR system Cascade subunit CasD
MDRSVLLLWLQGPMQSWGTRSRWDVRDTGLEPTKSGVIGLLGCALGLERGDQELQKLDREISFGVRVDLPGVVSTDYQTVTGYHRTAAGEYKHSGGTSKSFGKANEHQESTIVSPRDYLHDAVFLVALQASQNRIIALERALRMPRWPLYLGRKSCPTCGPLIDQNAECFSDLRAALASRTRHDRAPRHGTLAAYVEDAEGGIERQDAVRINQLRMYEYRRCTFLEVNPPCSSPA